MRAADAVQVDSPLRNPYTVKRHGAQALPMFRLHLFRQIGRLVPDVISALDAITADSVLGCWCVDLDGAAIFTGREVCHCQIIWKAWRWLQQPADPEHVEALGRQLIDMAEQLRAHQ